MQLYYGIDPIAVAGASSPGFVTFPFPSGHGSYTLAADCITADILSAQNLSAGIQGNRDAIVWLTWRTIDWVSGGDYSAYTASIIVGNFIEFVGLVQFGVAGALFNSGAKLILGAGSGANAVFGGAVFNIGDPAGIAGIGHLRVWAGSDVTIEPDGGLFIGGTSGHPGQITVQAFGKILGQSNSALTMQSGSATTFAGVSTYSGAAGYRVVRKGSITGAVSGFPAEQWDVIELIPSADFIVALSDPAALPEGICMRFTMPGSSAGGTIGHTVDIHDHSGNEVAQVLNSGGSWGAAFADIMTANVSGTVTWICTGYAQI